jgi:CheY-like chemotaxis protein
LVCPDEAPAQVLRRVLEELSIHVESCPDISRAAIRLAQERFDVVILDCASQDEVTTMLRESRVSRLNDSTLAVAVVQGQENIREMFALGVNFVLYKPVSYERALSSMRAARALMRKERRRTARASVHTHAKIDYSNVEQEKATLVDLAEDGMSIHSGKKLPPSCKVYFQFDLPGQKASVRLSGQVVWQDWNGRVGIRFMDVPKASRRMLQEWLQTSLPSAPSKDSVSGLDVQIGNLPDSGMEFAPEEMEIERLQPNVPKSSPSAADSRLVIAEKREDGEEQPGEESTVYSMRVFTDAPKEKADSDADNRRGQTRYACRLGAEVYRTGKSVPTRCALTDLSATGCYLEMTLPFVAETRVEIVVRTAELKLRLSGRVKAAHPGFGMGIFFDLQTKDERAAVQQLLDFVAATMPKSER